MSMQMQSEDTAAKQGVNKVLIKADRGTHLTGAQTLGRCELASRESSLLLSPFDSALPIDPFGTHFSSSPCHF
jgi:hypothetical protein